MTLYFECNMGAAGDMLLAALLELHDDPEGFLKRLNAAGIPATQITAASVTKQGVRGTHVNVSIGGVSEGDHDHDHDHHHDDHHHNDHHHSHTHHHNSPREIGSLIDSLHIPAQVKADALAVYRLIAEAESHVHGVAVEEIHFHEVGNLDAVTDIVGVCLLLSELAPERVIASPVHVGAGQVRCAHGLLPVPAPATAYILRGVPFYGGGIDGELCTPTGAALLKYFAREFGPMPPMTVKGIGYGMGAKDFPACNCVRAFAGVQQADTTGENSVAELSCNLDDMTPEAVAFAAETLLGHGALDVYTTPVVMKKGRAGVILTCLCAPDRANEMITLLFKHTTTLGVRETLSRRVTLRREIHETQTAYGAVRVKTAEGCGVTKSKPEYEDLARIARENDLSLLDAARMIETTDPT